MIRLFQRAVIIWLLACTASAQVAQTTPDQPQENQPRNDTPSGEQRQRLDRRDRIFYPDDTERPKPLLKKLVLNIALDQKDIFTSPFRVSRDNALEWLIPVAATGGLIAC